MAKIFVVGDGGLNEVLKERSIDIGLEVYDDIVESSINESFEHHAYDTLIYREVDDSVDSKQVFRNFVSGKRSNRRW